MKFEISGKTIDLVRELGIGPDTTDADEFIRSFKDEMTRGIDKKGSSLAMIPTYMSCEKKLSGPSTAVAIDMGGTNFRTALIGFNGNKTSVDSLSVCPTPGTYGELTWDEFIHFVAERVRPLLRFTDTIGICISFPTEITPEADGIIQHFTKEVDISGFGGKHVCRDLAGALGIPSGNVKAINDTTAVLLSGLLHGEDGRGLVGMINGTGTNICCQIDRERLSLPGNGKMIVAVESGGFIPTDKSPIDRILDGNTIAPGVYQEEKVVAGAYIGEICRLSLKEAAGRGVIRLTDVNTVQKNMEIFTTPEMDAFGAGKRLPIFETAEDEENARYLVRSVFDRAAKHIVCTLKAVNEYTMTGDIPMTVSYDGSMFTKSLMFRSGMDRYLPEFFPGKEPGFVTMENSTVIGTALGAIVN